MKISSSIQQEIEVHRHEHAQKNRGRNDILSNPEIGKNLRVESILNKTEHRKLSPFEHLARMERSNLVK